eukprot:1480189-Pyramimonas_sp.AAC.1
MPDGTVTPAVSYTSSYACLIVPMGLLPRVSRHIRAPCSREHPSFPFHNLTSRARLLRVIGGVHRVFTLFERRRGSHLESPA